MEGTLAPEQIIINGQEYSSEDATQLIELGSKYKKMESDLNTSLDKVYPEYTKATQRAKELEKQLAERNAEFDRISQQKAADEKRAQTPDEIVNARKAAREIGLADEDYLKEKGYMTKSEIDAYFTEKDTQKEQVKTVLNQATQLEKEIDGSDGRVPFDQKAVLAYASAYSISDLTDAYDQMNEKANAKWKQQLLEQEERPGLTTLRPGGKKSPEQIKITDDNLGQVLGEFLNGLPE